MKLSKLVKHVDEYLYITVNIPTKGIVLCDGYKERILQYIKNKHDYKVDKISFSYSKVLDPEYQKIMQITVKEA